MRFLRRAYSSEMAAALAYRGHWRSVKSAGERARIVAIEEEEWQHREAAGEMLRELGGRPSRWREAKAFVTGLIAGAACHFTGRLLPMYGAGRLEARNVEGYESAARLALGCGRRDYAECLLAMARAEREHEEYFRSRLLAHFLGRHVAAWPARSGRADLRGARLP